MTADADWFAALTGFPEFTYADTQAQLEVSGSTLRSRVNGRRFHIGTLSTPLLGELRERASAMCGAGGAGGAGGARGVGRPRLALVQGDVAALHRDPAHHGAVFQVASQFNLLEMTGPSITPEYGVTRYALDLTQGPACAMAAGAATIYRNYCMTVRSARGQTATRQVDCLQDVGEALGNVDGSLWEMRNGYAICSEAGLARIHARMAVSAASDLDALRDRLRVGVHADVEVTLPDTPSGQRVTQVFCSALPVRYTSVPPERWQAFATLVLEGAYEATLWTAAEQAARGGSNIVFLTLLGGGAFGNLPEWIHEAIRRAMKAVRGVDLDVRIVSRREPDPELRELVASLR